MPLFLIKGVDTNSREYLKSIQTQSEIVHTVAPHKRVRTSLAQQHNLLSDEAAGTTVLQLYYSQNTNDLIIQAIVTQQEVEAAMHAHAESDQSPAAKRKSWTTRLSLLKEDKANYYFRMAYFHHLHKRVLVEISEAEAALKALPDTTELE